MKKILFLLPLLILCSAIVYGQARLNQAISQFSMSNPNLTQKDLKGVAESDGHVSSISNIHHSYFAQSHNGIEIFGSTASLHTDPTGKVVHANNNLVANVNSKVSSTSPSLSAIQAVQSMAVGMGYGTVGNLSVLSNDSKSKDQQVVLSQGNVSIEDIPVKLMYYPLPSGSLQLVWEMTIHEHSQDNVWQLFIDANTGKIIDKFNMVIHCNFGDHDHSQDHSNHNHTVEIKEAAKTGIDFEGILSYAPKSSEFVGGYMVFAMPIESPYFGSRTMETDPDDPNASPYGWHDTNGQPGSEFTDTRGNNVDAYEDGDNQGHRASGGASLQFNFPFNQNYSTSNQSEDAALTNLFYWNNIIHDVLNYQGFDAPAGNFQKNNYGQSGSANDDVRAEAQDGSGTCNANMLTLPDGSRPRMQMYTCNNKDGDFDNLVIVHEYGHGISKRLTGGRTTTSCLTSQEQQGEGISDFYGLMLTMDASNTPTAGRTVGTYLFGQGANGAGIRPKPYSTSMTTNNATYNTIKTSAVPHGVGYVWCTMLWEMTWEIMAITAFDPDFYQGTGGNNVAMKLVTEGLKLQPCQPGFVDARDAILAADQALYGGAYKCAIWTAFAKRGLGQNANQGSVNSKTDGTENYTVPSTACSGGPTCTVSVSPSTVSVTTAGGTNNTQVTATSGQSWTASTTASWITVNTTSGTGSGSLSYTVAANTGGSRSGTITVTCGTSTATVTINQAGSSGGCQVSVSPSTVTVATGGGNNTAQVTATAGQSWTASTTAPWITVTGGTGTGSGTFSFTTAANTGGARTATINVSCGNSSATVTVNQSGSTSNCNITVSPTAINVPASTGSGSFQVSANQQWSATTAAAWLQISPSSGNGNGTITYNYAANTGPARTGVINLFCAGVINPATSFTVNQAGAVVNNCSQLYATLPYSTGFEQGQLDQFWCTHTENASGRVRVTNLNGPNSGNYHLTMDCSTSSTFSTNDATLGLDLSGQTSVRLRFGWREYTDEDHVEDGLFFSDDGGLTYSRAYNFQLGPQSYTKVDINVDSMAAALGLSLTNQFVVKFQQRDNFPMTTDGIAIDDVSVKSVPVGCNISVNPTTFTVASAGVTNAQVTVTGTGSWTALSSAAWITVTNGTGTGSGSFNFSVPVNTGVQRIGTINVSCGSQNIQVTITQAGAPQNCTQQYAAIPYTTGFENGLDQYWCTASENAFGRVQVTSANVPNAGTNHLTMDVTTNGNYSTNEATLGLQLAGKSNVKLGFYFKEFSEENDLEDGVFFSDDGGATYVNVYALHNFTGTYTQITLDVDALAQANGLQLNNTFVVKFQQRDNFSIATDGMAFDDVSVTTTVQTCNLAVTPKFHSVPAAGGTVQSTIISNAVWQAAANNTWITIAPTTGSGTTTMDITVTPNTSPLGRIGQIIIKCPTTTLDTIRILQQPAAQGCTQQYVAPPYTTGFESGVLDANWCTYSSSAQFGRIQITDLYSPNTGTQHMTMDVTTNGNINTNEAHLGLDLSGVTDAVLSFAWKEFGDESNYQDGVWFSDDGGASFTKAYDLINGSTTYQTITIDIDLIAAYLGLSLTNTFIVKFQQYDNFSIPTDGFAFDDISVTAGATCGLSHPPLVYAPSYASSVSIPVTGSNWMASTTASTPSWMWLIDSTGASGDLVKVGMFYNNSLNQRTGSIDLACATGAGSSTMTITQGGYPNLVKGTPVVTPFGGDTNSDGIIIEYYEEAPGLSFLNNRPNPFDQSTTIEFILEDAVNVSLMITDITGKVIAEPIVNEMRDAGNHNILFRGEDIAPGVYMYTLETNGFRTTKQMVIAR